MLRIFIYNNFRGKLLAIGLYSKTAGLTYSAALLFLEAQMYAKTTGWASKDCDNSGYSILPKSQQG
jgi:hypothetical protein